MRRAKRSLAAALCLFPAFDPSWAEAARVAAALSAPAPVLRAPAALGASSLSVLPISAAASATLPVLAAPSVPAAPIAPIPAALSAVSAESFPVISAENFPVISAARPVEALRALAVPGPALEAGLAFDGARTLAAAKDGTSVPGDAVRASAPNLQPPSKVNRPRSTAGRFLRAAALGVGASAAAPWLWSAMPVTSSLLLFAVAILPIAAAASLLLTARIVRGIYRLVARKNAPVMTPPTRRAKNVVRALGLAFGLALTATTVAYKIPLIQAGFTYMESRLPASEREFKSEIGGKFFAEETVRALSQTEEGRSALDRVRGRDGVPRLPAFFVKEARQSPIPLRDDFLADAAARQLSLTSIGRETLDGLRDRGGVLRMPVFFVSYQDGSAAKYTPPDVVFLSVATIERGGVTVEEFLNDRQAQLDYLHREQALILHELKHAHQARRAMDAGTWKFLRTNGSRLASAAKTYFFGEDAKIVPALPAPPEKVMAKETVAAAVPEADITAAPIVIDAAEIHRMGLTVEQFLDDEKAQKDYILRHRDELARAFKAVPPAKSVDKSVTVPSMPPPPAAAPQEKRSFEPNFGMIQEWEYEAYIADHLYTHERLRADPGAAIMGREMSNYERGLQDFDAFLRSIDDGEIYADNFHSHTAFYERYLAKMRAGWDAHRVEAAVLLARRALAAGDRDAAKEHLEQARALAAEKGLPAPELVIPAR